jgi:hypothetical protein
LQGILAIVAHCRALRKRKQLVGLNIVLESKRGLGLCSPSWQRKKPLSV